MRKKFLVLRFSAMGDVAILATLLHRITTQNTDIKLVVVTKQHFAPMFYTLKNVSVIPVDFKNTHKGIVGVYRLFNTLKVESFAAVLDMHLVLRTRLLKLFYRLFSPKTPFIQIDKGRKEKRELTRLKNKIFRPLKPTYNRYGDVFEKAGIRVDYNESLWVKRPDISPKVESFLEALPKFKIVGIAPFAAHQGKVYPLDRMENIISQLSSKNINIFLFGGGGKEKQILDKVAQNHSNTYNITQKFSFEEELEIISHLNVMIAMDSGNAHLSAMYGVPTITLWGVTHPYAGFYPYAQPEENAFIPDRSVFNLLPTSVYGNKVVQGYEKAIETLQEEKIVQRVVEVLCKKE